jgi:very-short-patch-repair endonuclease
MREQDRKLFALAVANNFLVGREQVRAAGLTSRQWVQRVAAGEWQRLHSGVWCHAATPVTWELRVRAGALWLGGRAALAGAAAARWWGLDGFEGSDEVEFVVPRARRSKGGPAVHTSNEWPRTDFLFCRGIRATVVTRTLLDLAAFGAGARQLEQAIDSGIRHRRTSVPTLTQRMATAGAGRRGVVLLRELLLDAGGESALERRFLRLLRTVRIGRPQTQVTFRTNTTRAIRVDFLFANEGVVVEVSGRIGHASDLDRRKDARRRNQLQQWGLVVLEFTTADVIDDPMVVLKTLPASLDGRGHKKPTRRVGLM